MTYIIDLVPPGQPRYMCLKKKNFDHVVSNIARNMPEIRGTVPPNSGFDLRHLRSTLTVTPSKRIRRKGDEGEAGRGEYEPRSTMTRFAMPSVISVVICMGSK